MFASIQVSTGRIARLVCLALTLGALANVGIAQEQPNIEQLCQGTTIHSELIGESKNVVMETIKCASGVNLTPEVVGGLEARELEARQSSNVCGANCATNCFTPAGGGPNPNDCKVISDAILFDSQSIGNQFNLPPTSQSLLLFRFVSCEAFMVNQVTTNLTYCRTDLSALVDILAFNCQAPQNAHGGNCIANDQRWFVQVDTAPVAR